LDVDYDIFFDDDKNDSDDDVGSGYDRDDDHSDDGYDRIVTLYIYK